MEWLEITVETAPEGIDDVTAALEKAGISGVVIDDEQDFQNFLENNRQYWDYVDEELLREKQGMSRVKFYVEAGSDGRRQAEKAKRAVAALKEKFPERNFGSLQTSENTVRDEDWENEYKKYYKPLEIGEKLLILPSWEPEPEGNSRHVLRLDPGISFGTGSHATTRLCLEFMEQVVKKGDSALDLGSGSGILAIGAMLLGAESVLGCDIDPLAADIAGENAALNGFTEPGCRFICGNVIDDRELRTRFAGEKVDLVLANIVADVIIPLSGFAREFMKPGGYFICSGIIGDRSDEVAGVLKDNGFEIVSRRTSEDWTAFLLK